MALLDEVGTYLAANLGTLTQGTNLFQGMLPDEPAVCTALFNTTSSVPYFPLNGSTSEPTIENPRLMVYVRHTSYSGGETLMQSVWRELTKVSNDTLSSVNYLRLEALGSPEFLERDDNFNVLFAANFQAMKALS